MADDEDKGLIEKMQEKAAREVAKRTVERTANRFLDELEEFLLGKKGAAEEILEKEKQQGSALDRIRRQYDLEDEEGGDEEEAGKGKKKTRKKRAKNADPPPETPAEQRAREREERRARARDELEAIKRRRAELEGAVEEAAGASGHPAPDRGGDDPGRDDPSRSFDPGHDGDEPPPTRRSKRSKRNL